MPPKCGMIFNSFFSTIHSQIVEKHEEELPYRLDGGGAK